MKKATKKKPKKDRPVRISRAEVDLLSPRNAGSILDWAEDTLVIGGSPFAPTGAKLMFDSSRFPLQREMIQAFDDDRWLEYVVIGPTQGAKTQSCVVVPILHRLACRGQSVLYMHATKDVAMSFWATKLLPTIRSSPKLAHLEPTNRAERGREGLRMLTNEAYIYFTGAESVAALTNLSIPVVVCDDVHAMTAAVGHHGHPVELAKTRQSGFDVADRTTILLGTAGTEADYHWQALQSSSLFRPYIPCPTCGERQLLVRTNLVFNSSDPEEAFNDVKYRCAKCEKLHTQSQMMDVLPGYKWYSTAGFPELPVLLQDGMHPYPQSNVSTKRCGWWYNALYWPKSSWGELALALMGKAEESITQTLQLRFAEPMKATSIEQMQTLDITRNLGTHRWGELPVERDLVLILSADPGGGILHWQLDAWQLSTGRCWLVEFHRFGQRANSLDQEVAEQERRENLIVALQQLGERHDKGWVLQAGDNKGEVVLPSLSLIDRGYLPQVIDEFVGSRKRGNWIATNGSTSENMSASPTWPGWNRATRVPVAGGSACRSFIVNTNQAKLELQEQYRSSGQRFIPADTTPGLREVLQRHLTSELFDITNGRWIVRTRANHFLDTGALGVVGAAAVGISTALPTGVVSKAPQSNREVRVELTGGLRRASDRRFRTRYGG